jgi:signal transduction histidine kinase
MRPERWCLQLPDSNGALRRRHEFREYLRRFGRAGDDYLAAELIFGELVGNAARYAPGPIEVLVEWPDGHAMIHVSDTGYPVDTQPVEPADPYAQRGRGLLIVSRLASSAITSTTYADLGKTVSVALPVHAR